MKVCLSGGFESSESTLLMVERNRAGGGTSKWREMVGKDKERVTKSVAQR